MMKLPQFLQDRVRLLHGRVFQWFVSGKTGKGQSTELLCGFHANGSLIDSTGSISISKATVIRTVLEH